MRPICSVLPIAPSTDRARSARRADLERLLARVKRDTQFVAEIRRVHAANVGVQGIRKVWRRLVREGIAVAR